VRALAARSEEVDDRLRRRAALRADDGGDEDAGATIVVGECRGALRHRNRQSLDARPAADRIAEEACSVARFLRRALIAVVFEPAPELERRASSPNRR